MRHPRDYSVNEAWIVFRLNGAPIETEQGGDFNVTCLMDAASCYILGSELVTSDVACVPMAAAERLIETGRAQANVLPTTLLLSSECDLSEFAEFAMSVGIYAERVPDDELSAFVSEAREGFRKHLGIGRVQ